MSPSCR